MKQGNAESDQTPDFVCFRKVVYLQGRNPEFRMFSRGKQNKKSDFREKKSDFREKKFGISFSPECFITKLFLENSKWTWRNHFK